MGYNTRFKAGVSGEGPVLERFYRDAENDKRFGDYDVPLSDFNSQYYVFDGKECKWYSWNDDLKGLSKEYPNLLFTLEGEGEEPGDLWKAWARNGKSVTVDAKITYPEPDLDKVLPIDNTVVEKERQKKVEEIRSKINALQLELDRYV